MSARKPPTAHLWTDGGGQVVRCDDPAIARPLMVDAYVEEHFLCPDDYDAPTDYDAELAELFPLNKARVEQGRMLGALPNSAAAAEGWSWAWYPDTGRGTTTAVVWSDNR